MKKTIIAAIAILGMAVASCNKEEIPTPERCNTGVIIEKGIKIVEQNTFVVDGETVTHERFEYYIWIIDECSGETIRHTIQEWEYNSLNEGEKY